MNPKIETAVARVKHGVLRYLPNDEYVGRSLELYGEYSDMEAGLLQQLIKPGAHVIEVGANIGALTLVLSRAAGPDGSVIAFEPQDAVYRILRANLEENGCANAGASFAALGNRSGSIAVPDVDYARPGNFGAVSLRGDGGGVPLYRLDDLDVDRLDLLKIDVEGMEAEVLDGARDTITRCQPILYVENDRAEKSAALIELIRSMGYRLWWHLPPLYNPDNVRGCRVDVFPGIVSVNMLCIPTARAGRMALREITSPQSRWQEAAAPLVIEKQPRQAGSKTCAVVRLGAYGDALQASSIFPALKAEGYHLTVYTEAQGEEMLRHDPHVDRLIVHDAPRTRPWTAYWDDEAKHYDRFINLTESVEKNVIAIATDLRFYWPKAMRERTFGGNYSEQIHALAGVPFEPRQAFYPGPEERTWALNERMRRPGPLVVIAHAGSSAPKVWPHTAKFAEEVLRAGASVTILGDLRELGQMTNPGVELIGMRWNLRKAMAFTQLADVVIGQETALLNAVALEPMHKVVLLSHSTRRNLTEHWVNTTTLCGAAACWPCHQIHQDLKHCTRDAATGAAACQASIDPDGVLRCVMPYLNAARRARAA